MSINFSICCPKDEMLRYAVGTNYSLLIYMSICELLSSALV